MWPQTRKSAYMSAIKKNTWYESPKSKRFFVIVGIWNHPENKKTIELLEKGHREPVILGEPELETLIKSNELVEVLPPEIKTTY